MAHSEINIEQQFHLAIQVHQQGKSQEAEIILRNILEKVPGQDGIMTTLGAVLLSMTRVDEATQLFQKAVTINPDNLDAQLNLGIAYQSLGKVTEAGDQFMKTAELAPERAEIQFNYSNYLLQNQRFTEGLEILKKVIQIDPSMLAAYHSLINVYSYLGQNDQVFQIYEKALIVFPTDLMLIINMGNLYADLGLLDKAQATYVRATDMHPDHFLPKAVLGRFFLDIGKMREGQEALLDAIAIHPNDLNTNILLGNVSKDLGLLDAAEEYYRKAIAIDPNEIGAVQNLRRILSSKIPYWHFEMLADTDRNDVYQKAIEKAVKPTSTILDIGTGSGLLSMMAARAGAKHVTACELHQRLAETAKEITKVNGYEKVINVFAKKSTQLKVGEELAEKVDIIISEILDVGVLGEGVLPSLRHAINNLAKPNVKLIPSNVKMFGQLIEIPSRSIVAPIQKISGFDLSLFEQYRIPNEYLKINLKAEKYTVLSDVFPLLDIDFYQLPPAFADDQPRQFPLNIPITQKGTLQAIVFWFDLYLDDDMMVSSAKNGKLEHWGQALFCFPNPHDVESGAVIPITMFQSDQIIRFEVEK